MCINLYIQWISVLVCLAPFSYWIKNDNSVLGINGRSTWSSLIANQKQICGHTLERNHVGGHVHSRGISITNQIEIPQPCTKPSISEGDAPVYIYNVPGKNMQSVLNINRANHRACITGITTNDSMCIKHSTPPFICGWSISKRCSTNFKIDFGQ